MSLPQYHSRPTPRGDSIGARIKPGNTPYLKGKPKNLEQIALLLCASGKFIELTPDICLHDRLIVQGITQNFNQVEY